MSQLIPFEFESKAVRVILGESGESWFVASDVCRVLEIMNTADVLKRLDDDEKGIDSIYTLGGNQEMATINESGLYNLILGSRKPEAKKFKKWVTSEVLPTIRKTGTYSLKPMTQQELAKAQVLLLEQLEETARQRDFAIATKAEIGTRREATAMNTASQAVKKVNQLEVELDRSKQYYSVKRMQMIHHGQQFSWRLLKSTGIEMGIEPIDVFDANYGTVNAYHIDVWREAYAIEVLDAA